MASKRQNIRCLLTGASGFVGGHLVSQCPRHIDLLPVCGKNVIKNGLQIDLTHEPILKSELDRLNPHLIIHTAAISNLDSCERNPQTSFRLNVTTPMIIAQWAETNKARLIHFSSDMVFDGQSGMYTEEDTVAPLSAYGEQKAESEIIVLKTCSNAAVVRCALVFGRPSFTGLGSSFSMWIENRLKSGKKVPLFTDQYRTPIWVENLAALVWELALSQYCGFLHLGGANRITRFEFGQEICTSLHYDKDLLQPISMFMQNSTARRPRDVSLDTLLAHQVLKTTILSTSAALERWD